VDSFDTVDPIFTWSMAEELAVGHLRSLGFADARRTPPGADRGIDAIASSAVAQVKHHAAPVGAPDVQRLRGAAHDRQHAVFYSGSGYTSQAIQFADGAGVALFSFDRTNRVSPVNDDARRLTSAAQSPTVVELRDTILELLPRFRATMGLLAPTILPCLQRAKDVVAAAQASDSATVHIDFDLSACGAAVTALTEWADGVAARTDTVAEDSEEVVARSDAASQLPPGSAARREAMAEVERRLTALWDAVRELRTEQVSLIRPLVGILGLDPESLGVAPSELDVLTDGVQALHREIRNDLGLGQTLY